MSSGGEEGERGVDPHQMVRPKEVIKRFYQRVVDLISSSDPEPVIFISSAALIVFGATLLFPGHTFSVASFSVFRTLIDEEFAGVILLTVGILAMISLIRGSPFLQFMCLVLVGVHVFLATVFVLSGLNSTGNTYYVYAAGAAWASWRLIYRV